MGGSGVCRGSGGHWCLVLLELQRRLLLIRKLGLGLARGDRLVLPGVADHGGHHGRIGPGDDDDGRLVGDLVRRGGGGGGGWGWGGWGACTRDMRYARAGT